MSDASREREARAAAPDSAGEFRLRRILEEMVRRQASDLHLKVGRVPVFRVHGTLIESDFPAVRADDTVRCADQLLTEQQRETFAQRRELDFAVGVQGLGRFRVNLFQQRGTLSFAFRAIPIEIPSMRDLMLPPVLEQVAMYSRGLVLVTGITGSGKSTTLASLLQYMNENRAINAVTIEDPIEFLHRDRRSLVSQREVGTDTDSFNAALRHVLRQDPDVIILGEIRDQDSMETVLKAANTGHLVLSTLHTADATHTIRRIMSFFPPHEQMEVRQLLADALRAIVSMRLLPRADGRGRVPAVELLINTAAVSDRVREGEQLHTLPDLIADGRNQYGMQTFDQHLLDLLREGMITQDVALSYATRPAELALRISGIESASELAWDPGRPGLEA